MPNDDAPIAETLTVSQILIKATAMAPALADELAELIAVALSSSSPEAIRKLHARALKPSVKDGKDQPRDRFVAEFLEDVAGISKPVAKAVFDWFEDEAQQEATKLSEALAGKGKKKSASAGEKRAAKIAEAEKQIEAANVDWPNCTVKENLVQSEFASRLQGEVNIIFKQCYRRYTSIVGNAFPRNWSKEQHIKIATESLNEIKVNYEEDLGDNVKGWLIPKVKACVSHAHTNEKCLVQLAARAAQKMREKEQDRKEKAEAKVQAAHLQRQLEHDAEGVDDREDSEDLDGETPPVGGKRVRTPSTRQAAANATLATEESRKASQAAKPSGSAPAAAKASLTDHLIDE